MLCNYDQQKSFEKLAKFCKHVLFLYWSHRLATCVFPCIPLCHWAAICSHACWSGYPTMDGRVSGWLRHKHHQVLSRWWRGAIDVTGITIGLGTTLVKHRLDSRTARQFPEALKHALLWWLLLTSGLSQSTNQFLSVFFFLLYYRLNSLLRTMRN